MCCLRALVALAVAAAVYLALAPATQADPLELIPFPDNGGQAEGAFSDGEIATNERGEALAAWWHTVGDTAYLRASRLAADGTPLAPVALVLDSVELDGTSSAPYSAPVIEPLEHGYVVAWRRGGRVFWIEVLPDGLEPSTGPRELFEVEGSAPVLIAATTDGWLVVAAALQPDVAWVHPGRDQQAVGENPFTDTFAITSRGEYVFYFRASGEIVRADSSGFPTLGRWHTGPNLPLAADTTVGWFGDSLLVTWLTAPVGGALQGRLFNPENLRPLGPISFVVDYSLDVRGRPRIGVQLGNQAVLSWQSADGRQLYYGQLFPAAPGTVYLAWSQFVAKSNDCVPRVLATRIEHGAIHGLCWSDPAISESGLVASARAADLDELSRASWATLSGASAPHRDATGGFSDSHHLLTWVVGDQLKGALYTRDGGRLGDSPIAFGSIGDARATVSSISSGFLVAWARDNGENAIVRIALDGSVEEMDFGLASRSQVTSPVTRLDTPRPLLVWHGGEVFARGLDGNGAPEGSELRPFGDRLQSPISAIAGGPDSYLFVTLMDDDSITATRLSQEFRPLDFVPAPLAEEENAVAISVASVPGGWQVVWVSRLSGSPPSYALRTRFVSTDGSLSSAVDTVHTVAAASQNERPPDRLLVKTDLDGTDIRWSVGWARYRHRLRRDGAWTSPAVPDSRGPVLDAWQDNGQRTFVAQLVFDPSPKFANNRVSASPAEPLTATGSACTNDSECLTGHCVAGVCCESACGNDGCSTCLAAGGSSADGRCEPVEDGQACLETGVCTAGVCTEEPEPPPPAPPDDDPPTTPPGNDKPPSGGPNDPPSPPAPPPSSGCSTAPGAPDGLLPMALLLLMLVARNRRSWLAFSVAVISVAGCGTSNASAPDCAGLVCPSSLVCVTGPRCVDPQAMQECSGLAEGAPCLLDAAPGTCRNGVCETNRCGNGYLEANELCDDGNRVSGDGCAADCRSDESCGNGVFDWAAGEECDCGDSLDRLAEGCTVPNASVPDEQTSCTASCRSVGCGDGVKRGSEDCDGATEATCEDLGFRGGALSCSDSCRFDITGCERCGNGTVEPPEICDGSPPEFDCVSLGFDAGHVACTALCIDSLEECSSLDWKQVFGFGTEPGFDMWSGEDLSVVVGDEGLVVERGADGSEWTRRPPLPDRLRRVHGNRDATLVIALGYLGMFERGLSGEWTKIPSIPPDFYPNDVHVFSDGRAIVVGSGPLILSAAPECAMRVRDSSGQWSPGLVPASCTGGISSIGGSPNGDAVFLGTTDGQLYRLAGDVWEATSVPETTGRIYGLAVFDPDHALASTDDGVLRFDGATWTPLPDGDSEARNTGLIPHYRGAFLINTLVEWYSPGGQRTLLARAGDLAEDDQFVGFTASTDGALFALQRNGIYTANKIRWILGPSRQRNEPFSDVFLEGDVPFAVTIGGQLHRLDLSNWTPLFAAPVFDQRVSALGGSNSEPSLLVGAGGFVAARSDSGGWRVEAVGATDADLRAVWSRPDEVFYAAGDRGTVLQRADEWSSIGPGGDISLRAVSGRDDELYVAGDEGVLLRHDGTQWRPAAPALATAIGGRDIHSLWMRDDVGVAVGEEGLVLIQENGEWRLLHIPSISTLTSVHGTGASDLFAVGGGELWHWDGRSWARIRLANVTSEPRKVRVSSDTIVLDNGLVLARGVALR